MKNLIKLFMVVLLLTVFNGCQNDDLINQTIDQQLQEKIEPDIYLENDYLVFKDFRTLA